MSLKDSLIAGKFRVGKKIGEGSFGQIYEGTNIHTNDDLALKFEPAQTKHPQLIYESKLLKLIEGGLGIPEVQWSGTENNHNIMVLDLLGPSLEDLFTFCSRQFSLKTVLMLVDQILCRIEYVHSKNFLHRDIKPDNFLIGYGKRCTIIYVIDFGLAKKYRDSKGKHIPKREGKSLTGTARYASINAHLGNEQGRRDDLEAIGYVLMYFLRGSLPWQGINTKTREEKYRLISTRKQNTKPDELCKGFPSVFRGYFEYIKGLRFHDEPDYKKLRNKFKALFAEEKFLYDYVFDWTSLNHTATQHQNKILEEEKNDEDEEDDENEENIEEQGEVVNGGPLSRNSANAGDEDPGANPDSSPIEKPDKKKCIVF